jgi:tetratricopeptide (TPR) repeat protein
MNKIAKILIPLGALALAAALPFPYMFMGSLMDRVGKALRIEVDPRYSGGEVLAKFLDPMDDDRGEGGLVYPNLPSFEGKRVLDIVKYTVHRPVLNTAAGDSPDFWQLAVTFSETANPLGAPLGFSLPVIHIYIDVDGKDGGSTGTAQTDAELLAFDPAHPWDYMVHVDGWAGDKKGYIVSFDQRYRRPVEVFFVEAAKTVHIRLGLDDPGIKRILDGRTTYHYVVVGAFDPYSPGGFMPLAAGPGPRNGGGARSALTPRIFDWVAPKNIDQSRILSSYDATSETLATLVPLEVKENRGAADSGKEETKEMAVQLLPAYRDKLARETAQQPRRDYAAEANRLAEQGTAGIPLIEAYYRAQMFEKAEEASRRLLEASPDNAEAATYLAMSVAGQSGQQSSPMKSMEFVNRAFAQFDKAFLICKTNEDRLRLYLQRGGYFARVPESIFRKSAAAADDFLKAAALLRRQDSLSGRSSLLSDCYINAARALARAGKADEAATYFAKAAESMDLTTAQIVALLEQGVVPAALRR